jgi:hypothetical protein
VVRWTPYEVVVRLSQLTIAEWVRFDGQAASQGVDPLKLPFDRLLNYIYTQARRNADSEDREQFDILLASPLPGSAQKRVVTDTELEREGDDFMNFMQAVT